MMRPEKSGPWLFEPAEGLVVNCVYITKSGRVLMPGSPVLWTIESFEQDSSVFIRWIGRACVPKKIPRKRLVVDDLMAPYIIDDVEGHLVIYDDVKDFDQNRVK
jgi:hypothetical protein